MCITSRSRTEWTDEQVVHALNPSTQEVETGRYLNRVQDSLDYTEKPCLVGVGQSRHLGQEYCALQGKAAFVAQWNHPEKEKGKKKINLNTFHPYKLPKVGYYANPIFSTEVYSHFPINWCKFKLIYSYILIDKKK